MEKEKFVDSIEEHRLYIAIQKFKNGELAKGDVQYEFGCLLRHILGVQNYFGNRCPHICSRPHTLDDYLPFWKEGVRILKLCNELVRIYMKEFRVGNNSVAEQCERIFGSKFKVEKPKKSRKKKQEE